MIVESILQMPLAASTVYRYLPAAANVPASIEAAPVVPVCAPVTGLPVQVTVAVFGDTEATRFTVVPVRATRGDAGAVKKAGIAFTVTWKVLETVFPFLSSTSRVT